MQKGLGRAWPRTEEKYNIGRGNSYNYRNCKGVEEDRKWRGRKVRDMDLGGGKFWVGEWWEAGLDWGKSGGMEAV